MKLRISASKGLPFCKLEEKFKSLGWKTRISGFDSLILQSSDRSQTRWEIMRPGWGYEGILHARFSTCLTYKLEDDFILVYEKRLMRLLRVKTIRSLWIDGVDTSILIEHSDEVLYLIGKIDDYIEKEIGRRL